MIRDGKITFFIVDGDNSEHKMGLKKDGGKSGLNSMRAPNSFEVFQWAKRFASSGSQAFGGLHFKAVENPYTTDGSGSTAIFDVITIIKSSEGTPQNSDGKHEIAYFLKYKSNSGECFVTIESFIKDFVESKLGKRKLKKDNYEKLIGGIKVLRQESIDHFAACFKDYFRDLKRLYECGKNKLKTR